MPTDTGAAGAPRPIRLVILARPDPIQIWTTNRVAALVPVAAVVSETGRAFGDRQARRLRTLLRKNGPWMTLDRYLDLAYFKWRVRRDGHDALIERVLGPGASHAGWQPGLKVLEVENVNDAPSVEMIRSLAPDLIFCNGVSILKKPVIDIPPLGVINIHTGVLPEYRGPSPEFWALRHGDFDRIGVTVHRLTEGIDDGDVILEERTPVESGDNEITLRCRNVIAGARLVAQAVAQIATGRALSVPQDASRARSFPRRTRRDDREMRRRLRAWERGQRGGGPEGPAMGIGGASGREK